MRIKGFLAAVLVALAVPALAAPSQAAVPTYRKVAEYDIGFGRITGIDVDGRSLYAMSSRRINEGGGLARFKLRNGDRLWRSRVVCPGWGPQAMDSVVFAQGTMCAGGIGGIYAVRARDGGVAYTTGAHTGVVGDGAAYLSAFGDPTNPTSGVIRAYDRKGEVLWESDLGAQLFALRVLASGDNAVYVLDDLGVVALSARDGSILWRQRFGAIEQFSDLHGIAANGMFLFSGETPGSAGAGGESQPFTLAMSAVTGNIVWASGGRLGDVANGIVYATEDGDVVRNDNLVARSVGDGSVVWTASAQYASGFADPRVDAGLVWVRAYDDAATPEFQVFDAADGTRFGRAPWKNVLELSDGMVFVPRSGGRVVAFAPV